MKSKTDLDSVKMIAKYFLYLDIEPTKYGIVNHPIINYYIISLDGKLVNILENKEAYKKYVNMIEKSINESENIEKIYYLIRKSYRLTFIKYTIDYITQSDLSKLLSDAWTSSENPNQDINCSIALISKWFKMSNKEILMNNEDYCVYKKLPETFVIFRGVGKNSNPYGLSWTLNHDKAKWFAHRFDIKTKQGYVQSCTINKKDVLAYFNIRGEYEIVVDHKAIKNLNISIVE